MSFGGIAGRRFLVSELLSRALTFAPLSTYRWAQIHRQKFVIFIIKKLERC